MNLDRVTKEATAYDVRKAWPAPHVMDKNFPQHVLCIGFLRAREQIWVLISDLDIQMHMGRMELIVIRSCRS